MDNAAFLPSAIQAQLTPEERLRAVVYIDDALRAPGHCQAGDQTITVPDPHWLAFIDRAPGANWMHATRYLLINSVTREITSIDSNRPPSFGKLSAGWRVLWRSDGAEDWGLMPIEAPHSR